MLRVDVRANDLHLARVEIINRSGLTPVSDYLVRVRDPQGNVVATTSVVSHVRTDGWLPLVIRALQELHADLPGAAARATSQEADHDAD